MYQYTIFQKRKTKRHQTRKSSLGPISGTNRLYNNHIHMLVTNVDLQEKLLKHLLKFISKTEI
jgi:hypothetical protein